MTNYRYRGCKNVEIVWHNTQADPDLIYRDYTFNFYDIEDALWDDFLYLTNYDDNESKSAKAQSEFNAYVQDNVESYLDDCIFGGYFANGSKTWHNN